MWLHVCVVVVVCSILGVLVFVAFVCLGWFDLGVLVFVAFVCLGWFDMSVLVLVFLCKVVCLRCLFNLCAWGYGCVCFCVC